jgi:glycosyltransferase involved in cell wall biosynthesis
MIRPPTVSVQMVAYNAERYVAEAVESLLAQTFEDFELVFVDDGSTDGTPRIVRGLAERDPRIRLISRPNTGIVRARNEALQASQGEFLAVMDSDDVALPRRLESQVSYMREHPECVALGCLTLVIDPDGDPLCYWNPEQTHEEIDALHLTGGPRGTIICNPTAMLRADAVRALGGYRKEYETSEDHDLFLRLAEVGRLANLPEPLQKYRMHPNNVGHARKRQQNRTAKAAILDACRRRGLTARPDPFYDLPARPGSPLELRRRWAWWALGSGHVATARKHARAALVRSPWSMASWRLMCCAIRGR